MFFKFITGVVLLSSVSCVLDATEILKDEARLLDSMSFEELLNTEIATGFPLEQKLAPAVTSIITSEEIRKSGARTLHEVLEQVPGLHIYPSDPDSQSPKVSIRGLQTGFNPQVLFLMDGMPLNDLLNGHPGYVFQMPVSIIHRVEVIRGPGSALHGADAFSGVVNIISKKQDNMTDQMGVRYGSFNTSEVWVNQSTNIGELNVGLALSLMKSDGDDGRIIQDLGSTTGPLDTRYDTTYFHADLNYKEIDMNLLIERSEDMGVGVGHTYNLDPAGHYDRDKILTDVQYTNKDWLDNATINFSAFYSYLDSQANFNPINKGPNSFRHGEPYAQEYMQGLSSAIVYQGLQNHTINMKIGYKYGKLDPNQRKNFGPGTVDGVLTDVTDNPAATYMLEQSRTNKYALLQDKYAIDDSLTFTLGARYDHYDDFGSTINPRLALVWQKSEDVTLKAMYGKAFRAPSFGELYLINNPALQGNPDLRPETIETYEIALNYRAKVHTKLNVFYYEATDLIDYALDPATTKSTAANIKDQTGYGLELELEYAFSDDLSLRGNYSYQRSQNAETKERVADAPVHQTFTQLQYKPISNLNINAQYLYIGKRYREATDARADLAGDSLVNMTVEYRNIFKDLDGLVSARNLFDTDYEEPSNQLLGDDYPMPGRSIFAEIRYRF